MNGFFRAVTLPEPLESKINKMKGFKPYLDQGQAIISPKLMTERINITGAEQKRKQEALYKLERVFKKRFK